MKNCNKCGLPKEFSKYHSDKRNSDKLQGICKDCYNTTRNLKYALNIEYKRKILQRAKKYSSKSLIRQKQYIETFSDSYVIASLKRGTNLTTFDIKQYPDLIESQKQILIIKRKIKNEKCQRT